MVPSRGRVLGGVVARGCLAGIGSIDAIFSSGTGMDRCHDIRREPGPPESCIRPTTFTEADGCAHCRRDRTLTVTASLLDHFPALVQVPVIGIVRGFGPESAESAVKVAFEEGIGLVEITMDSPDAIGVVERLTKITKRIVTGIGTVTSVRQVSAAANAGASFVVTPTFSEEVIVACFERSLPVIGGAATPTEILNTVEAGASAVKVFPAEQLGGPAYLRAIQRPLGNPPLVPTGGVTPDNAGAYLDSGAVALAAGSNLFTDEIGRTEDWDQLRRGVREWVEATK